MAKRGGQPGNDNATKNMPWRDAINRALARYAEGDKDGGLNRLADKLIAKCEEGDLAALKELGDRVEGKAAQVINVGGQPDNPIQAEVTLRPQETKEEYLARKGL